MQNRNRKVQNNVNVQQNSYNWIAQFLINYDASATN